MTSAYDVLTEHRDLVPLYLERRGARGPNAVGLGERVQEAPRAETNQEGQRP